jgi:hypothetical protein
MHIYYGLDHILSIQIQVDMICFSLKEIGFNVQEILFRWIWLKICILMYFGGLSNV